MMIISHDEAGTMAELDEYSEIIVEQLAAQGFDKNSSYSTFDNLEEKYTKFGWQFRRKIYLNDVPKP